MCELVSYLGAKVEVDGKSRKISVKTPELTGNTADYELVSKLRASFLVMGSLLARSGRAKVALRRLSHRFKTGGFALKGLKQWVQ